MEGYYVAWDPDRSKFVVSEYCNFVYDYVNPYQCLNQKAANDLAEYFNLKYEFWTTTTDPWNPVLKCADCLRFFYLDRNEKYWYLNRGLCIPKRCPVCRQKRRTSK